MRLLNRTPEQSYPLLICELACIMGSDTTHAPTFSNTMTYFMKFSSLLRPQVPQTGDIPRSFVDKTRCPHCGWSARLRVRQIVEFNGTVQRAEYVALRKRTVWSVIIGITIAVLFVCLAFYLYLCAIVGSGGLFGLAAIAVFVVAVWIPAKVIARARPILGSKGSLGANDTICLEWNAPGFPKEFIPMSGTISARLSQVRILPTIGFCSPFRHKIYLPKEHKDYRTLVTRAKVCDDELKYIPRG